MGLRSVTFCITKFRNSEGTLFCPSLFVRLYHSTIFSTVKRGVLMFIKVHQFVHKIYDFSEKPSVFIV